MHVIATAGHVDHGKSTLVRALTGQDPDRLEEEQRRGLSIELGYAWTTLEGAGDLAFVDVPGHERFISTMLAGIGPVPAALLVVAADDPWMPQAAEHLNALDALEVCHGVVAVSRSDLADPAPASARVGRELARTSLRGAPVVQVSGRTGQGLGELRARLVAMARTLPSPSPDADVRLWVDRRFTIKGAGTVVTGTLAAGTVRVGDTLVVGDSPVRVRAVQSLGRETEAVSGVARVALNLSGDGVALLERGAAVVTPGAWHHTDVLDVRVSSAHGAPPLPPDRPLLHVGATSVSGHCRPLSAELVRLRLDRPLPLRIGDRALLRDPGSRQIWGVVVADPMPPSLRRRGAAAARAEELGAVTCADLVTEVARRGLVSVADLRRIGVPVDEETVSTTSVVSGGGWLMSAEHARAAAAAAVELVTAQERESPLDPGLPVTVLAERLALPSLDLVRALLRPPLHMESGRVRSGRSAALPPAVVTAVETIHQDLEDQPFAAPTAHRLQEVGLDNKAAAAAARAGRLLRLAPGIVLRPGADVLAARWLADLPQPFTTSEARRRLGTSRRVALPLLDHLDRTGLTRRLPDDRREVTVTP